VSALNKRASIQLLHQPLDVAKGRPNGGPGAAEKDFESDIPFSVLEDVGEAPEADLSDWSSLLLSEDLLSAIASLGFTTPTPIQSSAIPKILQGHDVIGKAVTGSGKTLAYGIPIFEQWLRVRRGQQTTLSSSSQSPTALILAPTRELAHQLAKHISDLTQACPDRPRLATVTGGLSVQKQLRQLANADIIVGTPGRLWDVINESQELVNGLKRIKFLVVDEADRLLSEGHFKEVEEILDALDREVVDDADAGQQIQEAKFVRQTLVFSATFHKGLQQRLTTKSRPAGGDLLNNRQSMEYLLKKLSFREKRPAFVDVNPTTQMAAALNEAILECGAMEKDLYLYYLLLQNHQAKVLVFANSISSVKRLVPLLQNLNLPAVALHSTMPQKARLRSIERFAGQRTILVATDVAARGLDIKNIDLIVHYHVPRTADMYVHRSGRTARADKTGRSIMLCSPHEVAGVTRLIVKIRSEYRLDNVHADPAITVRLRPRLELSQKLTDATLTKEKAGTRDDWLRNAAEELGVDYDSDEFAAEGAKASRGRGGGNSKKQIVAGAVPTGEIANMRAQLNDLLSQRVNLGVSLRYLAGGNVDIDALLDGQCDSTFLGRVNGV
jgi:ATP-dependent RNA helicase DDX24/MAK5